MAQPPENFPPQDVVDFLREINDRLAHDPDNRDAFFDLFTDTGKMHEAINIEHVLAVVEALLHDYPHLLDRFSGLVDPVRQGLQFLKRAEKALSPANYDRFVAKLYSVEEEQSLDAHQLYKEFQELFGGEEDLLRGLADFLPRKYDPPPPPTPRLSAKAEPDDHRRTRPEHKRSSFAGEDDAPESSRPSWAKKKPRCVVETGLRLKSEPVCFADTGVAGSSRPSRARRPRCLYDYDEYELYDDDHGSWPERKPTPCAVPIVDGSKSSRPSRPKKKPSAADNNRTNRHAHAHAPVGGAAVHVAAAAAPAAEANAMDQVRRFREAWEFETAYSMLDATLKRATELKLKSERERQLDGGGFSMEELFPKLESRGFLANMYGDRWGQMRELLEYGGDRAAFALKVIVGRLTVKDAEAVDEARRRQDPTRAAQRLQEHARERVRLLEQEKILRETNEGNEHEQRGRPS